MKLYYNDAIISAYMAREFGVKYVFPEEWKAYPTQDTDKVWPKYFLDPIAYVSIHSWSDMGQSVAHEPRWRKMEWVVPKDSYHIFEPDDGDVVENNLGEVGIVHRREDGVCFFDGMSRM